MRRVFVFRPEPASRRTISKARELGLDAVSIPLFDLEKLDWSPPDPSSFDGLLLTSANTVKMGGDRLDRYRGLPVHAVGEGTAVAAEVAGLGIASIGGGGIDQLLAGVDPEARLLHLCGEDRRLPSITGRSITIVPIYRASEREKVQGLEDLEGQVAVLHSPRAARRLAERGLFLSHGDFYAATVVERLGLAEDGLLRAGCACYTTEEEIERLIEGVSTTSR